MAQEAAWYLARLEVEAVHLREQVTYLREANEQLVMALLATTAVPGPTAPAANEPPSANPAEEQDQLREANERLVIAALGAQNLQSIAEKAQRQQTQFLAVAAHELRSPLMPLRTAAGLLGEVPASEIPRLQAIVHRQVEHMTRLVGDLLDVSRVATGKLRLERRLIDLADVVEGALDVCRPAFRTRGQSLDLDLPAGPLVLCADAVRLVQVFINLLDNASKYTQDGGAIRIAATQAGDAVEVTVSDNGIGMSPEAISYVFEPFVQDLDAVSFNGLGLGIGLAVVREIVESHGGTVVAFSAGAGLGARFVVTLELHRLELS